MTQLSISNDAIISLFESHLAANPDQILISEHRKNDFDQMYRVASDKGVFLLRVAPPDTARILFYEQAMMRREVALMEKMQGQISAPIPAVVAADFDRRLIDRDYIIVEAPAGVYYSQITSLSHAQHDHVYAQLGAFLNQLHRITGSSHGYTGQIATTEPQQSWSQVFSLMWKNLINDVVACGMYNNEEALSLISLLEAYEAYFQRQSKPALLHMGIRKENIMVDQKGTITGLLGFEAALWGDPEVEFAVLDCAGIWASAFWKGYGAPRPTDLGSRTRRKFYILYEVQKNIPLAAKRYYDPEEAEQYKQTAITIATNLASATP
jgi:aminoglycoside phosphotransferase (APT) family kinase protein